MSERPNILLITTDQQRFDTINAAGNPHILTPHLDWLCRQGVRFTRCYSDCPICVPARTTIMTGLHGYTTGCISNSDKVKPLADNPTLPGLLTRHGYQTRAIGKMHFVPLRANYGFEHMELLPDYYRAMARQPQCGIPKDHGVGENEMEPVIATIDESHSLTHWTVDRSIDFLETRDATRPFFLWTSFAKPHPPFDPCAAYWELYRDLPMPPPVYGNWSTTAAQVPQGFMQPTYHLNNVHLFTPEKLRAVRRAYYACITQIDYNLGLLFARLREMELLRNTWIFFTADHGEMLGDHWLGAKSVFFEGSAHVPLLVRPPGEWDRDTRRDTTCDALACLADILPTCLRLADVALAVLPRTDGLDLLAQHEGRATRRILFGESDAYLLATDGQFKYQFTTQGGGELLFDVVHDPYEQRNLLAAGAACPAAGLHLRAALIEHLRARGHAAVAGGTLHALTPDQPAQEVHYGIWPGFHSRLVPTDVIH